ncbi:Phospholipase A(1) protein [Dioscorea alata]|uniref:Phospholipase A(1) protein n=1 Tax=Dioscorea alata TaxID=55571 RepID=A0ACB7UL41_DIOAL|nr:Phospholipase A(1) protein [Dioscorea alata]
MLHVKPSTLLTETHLSLLNTSFPIINIIYVYSSESSDIQIQCNSSTKKHPYSLMALTFCSTNSHHHHHHPLLPNSTKSTLYLHSTTQTPPQHHRHSGISLNIPSIISNLLHISTTRNSIPELLLTNSTNKQTPTSSPKESISSLQPELHGSANWSPLLNPLHPWLRREILKYGEFSQATYEAFDFDPFSEYCGSCLYNQSRLFEILGLTRHGYNVTKYIYAMSHVELPKWLERSLHADTWSKDSNWMGYVAVSDDAETRRIGCRDIVVAWRGTVSPSEWLEDLQGKLEPLGDHGETDAKVEHGFLSIYTSKSDTTRYNKSSASEQVMEEIKRLVAYYRGNGEEVSLTVTGHSLGGALALLNAHEAARSIPGLPVSVISFGAPRVGNEAFGDEIRDLGVKVLRVVVKQDMVPKLPGIFLNERIEKLEAVTGELEWVYKHVGLELNLNIKTSPYLKHGFDLAGFHNLETYLHLVDGYVSEQAGYRLNARRDGALVNKYSGMLRSELKIPVCWNQSANKGMVRNAYGRWVQLERAPEDIPSPHRDC